MATLTEYFETEARDCLAQLDRDLERPRPDAAVVQRAARALRGSAHMAREERVVRAAGALEAAARAVADERIGWTPDVVSRARQTVADLRVLVERRQPAAALDAVADRAVGRWRDAGIALPASTAKRAPDARTSASREFRAFAAREVTAIADALDRGVQQLAAAPMDREPLKMILRRQRALLGAARLQEVPVVAEILRAIDDLTRVIAKLDVGVKREWLDIYRIAREGLRGTIQPLQQDEDPRPSHALSRLRHMREELLERYGTGEAVSAAHESAGFTQATPFEHAAPEPASGHAAPAAGEPELLLEEEAVLELEAAAERDGWPDDDAVLDLRDVAEPPLDLTAIAEAPLLELDDVAEPALDLDEVAGPALDRNDVSEPVLDLDDVASPVLELTDVAEPPLLELDEVTGEPLLELDEIVTEPDAAAAGRMAEDAFEHGAASRSVESGAAERAAGETAAVVPIESLLYQREEALRRALELRDLVALSAIDPVTHEAVDELFDLIGIALR